MQAEGPLRSKVDLPRWLPALRCCPEEEQATPGGPSGLGEDPASDFLTGLVSELVRVHCENRGFCSFPTPAVLLLHGIQRPGHQLSQ